MNMSRAGQIDIDKELSGRCRTAAWLAMACIAIVAACSPGPVAPEPSAGPRSDASRTAEYVPTLYAGVCIDGSGSVPAVVVEAFVTALASTIEGWASIPATVTAGVPPAPGLDLTVRRVLGKSSLGVEGHVLHVSIPSLPGLEPEPPLMVAADHHDRRDWEARADDRLARLQQIELSVRSAAQVLREARWRAGGSEVAGCLAALAMTVPDTSERRLVILTDLEQRGTRQDALGTFRDAHVLVIDACVEARSCRKRERRLETVLRDRGAASVVFGRPEASMTLLSDWLRPSVPSAEDTA